MSITAGDSAATAGGIPLREIYGPRGDDSRYAEDIGDPGAFPYTRGKYRSGYRSGPWIDRNLCGIGSAAQTNERLKFLIAEGQSGLAIVPDTATQSGFDYDPPWGSPLVGLQGVPLACVEDMRVMCEEIDLASV